MRYPCLVLDHDDTAVMSTPSIHYPSFLETLRVLRPGEPEPGLKEFAELCCDPGFLPLCKDVYRFTDEEMTAEYAIWRRWTTSTVPAPHEGVARLLARHRALGGRVCVVSHSEKDNILRDYATNFGFEPDLVFGWERPASERKPNPYPLDAIMAELGFSPRELLVVDDLMPGLQMARARKVDSALARWSCMPTAASPTLSEAATYCFDTPRELERFLFDEAAEGTDGSL